MCLFLLAFSPPRPPLRAALGEEALTGEENRTGTAGEGLPTGGGTYLEVLLGWYWAATSISKISRCSYNFSFFTIKFLGVPLIFPFLRLNF